MHRLSPLLAALALAPASALLAAPPGLWPPGVPPLPTARRRSLPRCRPIGALLEADGGQPLPPTPPAAPQAVGSELTAVLALNVVTILWGSQHAVIKGLVDATGSPDVVNAARFAVAALLALPWAPRPSADAEENEAARATWAAGADLALWMFAGYALQAIGLQFTTASRSAFLLYLNVKFVPVLAFLLYGRFIPPRTWLSAAVAVAGTALLTYDGNPPNAGDAWSLGAAAASAVFILRLEAASRDSRLLSPTALNSASLSCTAALCAVWAAGSGALNAGAAAGAGGGAIDAAAAADEAARVASVLAEQAGPLLYLSLVTTAFANWLQAVGQQRVSAPDAAIIYALDPVYGAGFSWLLLGEGLGTQGLAGAGLVLLAVLISRTADDKAGDGGPPDAVPVP